MGFQTLSLKFMEEMFAFPLETYSFVSDQKMIS
jgi:hypothetical protein